MGKKDKRDTVKTMIKTSHICPTQYEGRLKSGKMFYFRYRWDCLSIRISEKPTRNAKDATSGKEIYFKENVTGDRYNGEMTDECAISHIAKVFDFTNRFNIQIF